MNAEPGRPRARDGEIEELEAPGRTRDPGPGPARRRRGPGPAARATLLVGGLAAAIVLTGLLGPRAVPEGPLASGSPTPAAADAAVPSPSPGGPIPLFRRAGDRLDDPHVLVAGRWMHLATGREVPGAPADCVRQRILVLGGGRIVCVTADVTRSPGSRLAIYDLVVATVGTARTGAGDPPPVGTPVGAAPQPLASLVGRRDVVIGDPVAIAAAPGPGPDDLALAWAVAGGDGFEIGLEVFRLGSGGGPAERLGDWIVGRAPKTGRDAIDTLADLAVAVGPAPDGAPTALVGWTEAGPGVAGPVRRLVAVPVDGSGPPALLPAAATRNLPPGAADGPLRTGTPCGGAFGEGLAGAGLAYVVCPGATAEVRLLGITEDGDSPAGTILATADLEPAGTTAGTAWLAGNGLVADPERSWLYRWSPEGGTLWRIGLEVPRGAGPAGAPGRLAVETLVLLPRGGSGAVDPARSPAARPILALDVGRGRLYALDALLPGTGRAVVHVIDLAAWRHFASLPLADAGTRAIALSPDGALLYASTEPRPAGSPPLAVGVAVLDATTGVERAYAGRLRIGAAGPLQGVVVR